MIFILANRLRLNSRSFPWVIKSFTGTSPLFITRMTVNFALLFNTASKLLWISGVDFSTSSICKSESSFSLWIIPFRPISWCFDTSKESKKATKQSNGMWIHISHFISVISYRVSLHTNTLHTSHFIPYSPSKPFKKVLLANHWIIDWISANWDCFSHTVWAIRHLVSH